MTIQATYADRLALGYTGQVADMSLSEIMSREVETASIGFGVAVIQGAADHGCRTGAAGVFLGITVRDIALDPTNADLYTVGDTAAILTRGTMFVTAGEAVVAGDLVYRTTAGVLNKTAIGNTLVANARWDTSAANGELARIRLS